MVIDNKTCGLAALPLPSADDVLIIVIRAGSMSGLTIVPEAESPCDTADDGFGGMGLTD